MRTQVAKKFIKTGDPIPIVLSGLERNLILEQTFVGTDITEPISEAVEQKCKITIYLSLEDIDDLLGYVAAAANHESDDSLQNKLDKLYGKLESIVQQYEEG